jgi:TPR repeat protein
MVTRPSQSFLIGIIAFSMWSSIALADPADQMRLGEEAFSKEDLSTAIEYFTKAAEANYAPAQVRLGEILDSSEYDNDAAEWYRKAAEQGYAPGEYHLGHMYAIGEGVEKNIPKAVYWLERAAAKNNLLAVRTLAQAYQKGELDLAVDLDKAKLYEDNAIILEEMAKRSEAKKAAESIKKGAGK